MCVSVLVSHIQPLLWQGFPPYRTRLCRSFSSRRSMTPTTLQDDFTRGGWHPGNSKGHGPMDGRHSNSRKKPTFVGSGRVDFLYLPMAEYSVSPSTCRYGSRSVFAQSRSQTLLLWLPVDEVPGRESHFVDVNKNQESSETSSTLNGPP